MIWTPRAALAGWNFYDFGLDAFMTGLLFGHLNVCLGILMTALIIIHLEHLNVCSVCILSLGAPSSALEHPYDCPDYYSFGAPQCVLWMYFYSLGAPPSAYMAYFTMPLDDSTFGAPQCVLWMYFYSLGGTSKCLWGITYHALG
jgi:hypothetical protein